MAVPTSRLKSRENPEWAAMTRQAASDISVLFGFVPSEDEAGHEGSPAAGRPPVNTAKTTKDR